MTDPERPSRVIAAPDGTPIAVFTTGNGPPLVLVHGARPQGLILCYEAGRPHVSGMECVPLVPLAELREIYERMAAILQPARVEEWVPALAGRTIQLMAGDLPQANDTSSLMASHRPQRWRLPPPRGEGAGVGGAPCTMGETNA